MVLNNKGSMTDILYIVFAILFISVTFLIAFQLYNTALPMMREEVQSSQMSNTSINAMIEMTETFDYLFLGLLIGLILAMVISSFLVDIHPIFMPMSIFFMITAIIISVPVSNIYQNMIANLSLESDLPLTLFIMANLPYFIAVLGTINIIVVYAGKRILLGGGNL